MPPLLTCALQNYFSAHLGLASRPIRPHFLSPEGGFAPFLPLPRSPGGQPGGRQLTWLSKALFYPLYWNPVLPPAPLGPTRSRRHPALLCPLCHGSHWVLHMKARVHGYRGKENAKKETVAKSYLFFFFLFWPPPSNLHKTFLFLLSHFKKPFHCETIGLVVWQVFHCLSLILTFLPLPDRW